MKAALLDYAEIAQRMGITAGGLRAIRAKGGMPEPDDLTSPDRPKWRESTITRWIKSRRRTPGRVPRSA